MDHDCFLAAICDRPNDDLPRLIYADYLDERGECDRAEFIRVQCELARVVEPHICGFKQGAAACWVCELLGRALDLGGAHWYEWDRENYREPTFHVVYRRGLLHTIRCSSVDWQRLTTLVLGGPRLTIGQAIVAAQPVERVDLTDCALQLSFKKSEHGSWETGCRRNQPGDIDWWIAIAVDRAALIDAMPEQLWEWGVGN